MRILMLAAILAAAAVAATAPALGTTPPAPLPGTKTAADRAAWRTIVHWPAGCENSWRDAGNAAFAGITVWKMPDGRRLIGVSCSLGAYQGYSMFYLLDTEHRARNLPLKIYVDPGSGKPVARMRREVLGVFDFGPKTGVLTVFDKFRGLGDCGIYSVFKLQNGRFVPVAAKAKLTCDGKPPYDPSKWPALPLP